MKLDQDKVRYGSDFWWVAHPDGQPTDPVSKMLVERRFDLEILGGVEDEEADYSYDEFALCELEGKYYLLSTAGCSCPSPSETWVLEIGPATLDEIEQHITSGKYEGYTLPKKQEQDFLELIRNAKTSAGN